MWVPKGKSEARGEFLTYICWKEEKSTEACHAGGQVTRAGEPGWW